jgi:cell division protein FtsW
MASEVMPRYASQPVTRIIPGRADGVIMLVVGTLMMIGVVMVASSSVSTRLWEQASGGDWLARWNMPIRHAVFTLAGFIAMLVMSQVDYRMWRWERDGELWRPALPWLVAMLAVVAMYVPGIGREVLGAQRSVVLVPGVLSFQPAELAKLGLVLWIAGLLAAPAFDVHKLVYGFGFVLVTAGMLIVLVVIEDFGTGALLGVVLLALLMIGGARWWHLVMIVPVGLTGAAGFILTEPYRIQRILTFFSPSPDTQGAGYQIRQAMLAIGSGGWFGRGLGNGVQKFDYLPQDNNDFILAIVCEELGIVGALVVVSLFLIFLLRGWWIAASCRDRFGQLVASGITLIITIQAGINIAVVTDSVPTKGISLPFVSAGGSGVIVLGVMAGLLASITRYSPPAPATTKRSDIPGR